MALSKLTYNSLNVTATASKGIGFDSGADDLAATFTGGSMTFIKKITASADSTISFVDGTSDVVLDDTYKEYIFTFKDIHPETDSEAFQFNLSADTGSNYNVTKTSTYFNAANNETSGDSFLEYTTALDLAQSTGFQGISNASGSDSDQAIAGLLTLFNPSSTTFVKHFIANTSDYTFNDYNRNSFIAGYGNTTSAVNAIQFKMNSGTFDGDICLYGIA